MNIMVQRGKESAFDGECRNIGPALTLAHVELLYILLPIPHPFQH